MDSSDAGPPRLFNFGGAHAPRVPISAPRRNGFFHSTKENRRRGANDSTRGACAPRNGDSALIERRYRRPFDHSAVSSFSIGASSFLRHSTPVRLGPFELRHSWRVRGRKLRCAVTLPMHRLECQDDFHLPKRSPSLSRDNNRSNLRSTNERNRVIHRRRRRAWA